MEATVKIWGKNEKFLWCLACGTIAMILSLLIPAMSRAADFSTALTKTVSEIPDGADVAGMGNASTATPEFSSRNPAIIAVESAEPSRANVTATYGMLNFKSGPTINLYSLTGSFNLPVGTMQLTLTDAGSNVGTLDDSTKVQFNSAPSADLQYGVKLGKNLLLDDDSLYGGVSYTYSQSKFTAHLVDPDFGDIFGVTKSVSHEAGVGMFYRLGKIVNVGALYIHSWDTADEYVNDIFDSTAKTQSDTLRLGVGVHVTSLTYVAADYRHLYLPSGQHDDQYFAGLEQYLIKDALALYGGYANGGATGGIGIYAKNCGLNLAYMHRPFRATEEFFGKAQVIMATLYATF